jgi:hypothetical protein
MLAPVGLLLGAFMPIGIRAIAQQSTHETGS